MKELLLLIALLCAGCEVMPHYQPSPGHATLFMHKRYQDPRDRDVVTPIEVWDQAHGRWVHVGM